MAVHDNEANGFYFAGSPASGIVYNFVASNSIGPTDSSAGNIVFLVLMEKKWCL
ncbi:hypothetical protein [Gracilibacillus xinjiangensis]|uniref:Uncharacterized protein n=1 Tax=Gracilibacillus xinjiangensis TaxID=1193282 RepID=A0ABV8WYI1_9BACI